MHTDKHPFAGKTVKLKSGHEYQLEDWWDRLGQGSWKDDLRNPACFKYALSVIASNGPEDDEVIYGKIGPYGYLVHESDLDL